MIATVVAAAEQRDMDVCIVTNDKDARQLLGPRVKIYHVRKNQYLGEAGLLRRLGGAARPGHRFSIAGGGQRRQRPRRAAGRSEESQRPAGAVSDAGRRPGACRRSPRGQASRESQGIRRPGAAEPRACPPAPRPAGRHRLGRRARGTLESGAAAGIVSRDTGSGGLGTKSARLCGTAAPSPAISAPSTISPARRCSRTCLPALRRTTTRMKLVLASSRAEPMSTSPLLIRPASQAKRPLDFHIIDTPDKLTALVAQLQRNASSASIWKRRHSTRSGPTSSAGRSVGRRTVGYYIPVRGPAGQAVLDPQSVVERLAPDPGTS